MWADTWMASWNDQAKLSTSLLADCLSAIAVAVVANVTVVPCTVQSATSMHWHLSCDAVTTAVSVAVRQHRLPSHPC